MKAHSDWSRSPLRRAISCCNSPTGVIARRIEPQDQVPHEGLFIEVHRSGCRLRPTGPGHSGSSGSPPGGRRPPAGAAPGWWPKWVLSPRCRPGPSSPAAEPISRSTFLSPGCQLTQSGRTRPVRASGAHVSAAARTVAGSRSAPDCVPAAEAASSVARRSPRSAGTARMADRNRSTSTTSEVCSLSPSFLTEGGGELDQESAPGRLRGADPGQVRQQGLPSLHPVGVSVHRLNATELR